MIPLIEQMKRLSSKSKGSVKAKGQKVSKVVKGLVQNGRMRLVRRRRGKMTYASRLSNKFAFMRYKMSF